MKKGLIFSILVLFCLCCFGQEKEPDRTSLFLAQVETEIQSLIENSEEFSYKEAEELEKILNKNNLLNLSDKGKLLNSFPETIIEAVEIGKIYLSKMLWIGKERIRIVEKKLKNIVGYEVKVETEPNWRPIIILCGLFLLSLVVIMLSLALGDTAWCVLGFFAGSIGATTTGIILFLRILHSL